ncbi:MAG: hypothetical protein KatS3mg039_0314 [Candidatus Kapaibacterium sp.]|nr:MAG: hypothetical protein KatS3mg039_0314 [Candidatus Kapabacteria bacterium]
MLSECATGVCIVVVQSGVVATWLCCLLSAVDEHVMPVLDGWSVPSLYAHVMGNAAIVVHPAVLFYRKVIADLQQQLREVLYRWYELVVEERPRLLDRYAELFGELEHTLQVETLRAAQVQRIVELVHLYVRRGEPITASLLHRICQLVERQHRHYRERVEATSRAEQSSHGPSVHGVSRAQACAQLYRDLVKRLHPDRSGNADLFERFWSIVQDAYSAGDLERLRAVHGIVCIEAQYRSSEESSVESLITMHRRLLYRIEYEQRRIERMLRQEPFVIAKLLDDPSWIASRRAALERQIERERRAAQRAGDELRRCGAEQWEDHFRTAAADAVPDDIFQDEFLKNTYFSMRA